VCAPPPGYLNVLVGQSWVENWCSVRGGTLHLHRERGDLRTPVSSVPLGGAEVVPGFGPKHPFAFRILQGGTELAALEVGVCVYLSVCALRTIILNFE